MAQGAALIGALVFCLGAISLFTAHPLQTFFRLLALASAAAMLLSVALMLLTFRNARSIDAVSMLLALAVSVISTIVSIVLSGAAMSMWLGLIALVAGGAIGGAWAETTLLFVDGEAVCARGAFWSLAVRAATFALNQIVSAFGPCAERPGSADHCWSWRISGQPTGLLARARHAGCLGPKPRKAVR
jgi:hypothetical protein